MFRFSSIRSQYLILKNHRTKFLFFIFHQCYLSIFSTHFMTKTNSFWKVHLMLLIKFCFYHLQIIMKAKYDMIWPAVYGSTAYVNCYVVL